MLDNHRIPRATPETAEAMKLGVFGAPTFVVEGEVFWGDDRLEDAIDWALNPSPA